MIPDVLARALGKPHFWGKQARHGIGGVPGAYDELMGVTVELARSGELALSLRFVAPRGCGVALEIIDGRSTFELVSITRDGMPHALRWTELEQLLRWAAVVGDIPHPSWPFALLTRGAPVCDEDGDLPLHALGKALATTVAMPDDVTTIVHDADCRGAGFLWTHESDVWTVSQTAEFARGTERALASTRTSAISAFPHAVLAKLLAQTEADLAPWRTQRVRDVAQRCAENERDTLPILRDALLDLGCERGALLSALEPQADAVHTGWVLELLLGLRPGTMLGRGVPSIPRAVAWRDIYVSFGQLPQVGYERVRTLLATRGIELGYRTEAFLIPVFVRRTDREAAITEAVTVLRQTRIPGTVFIGLPPTRTIAL